MNSTVTTHYFYTFFASSLLTTETFVGTVSAEHYWSLWFYVFDKVFDFDKVFGFDKVFDFDNVFVLVLVLVFFTKRALK